MKALLGTYFLFLSIVSYAVDSQQFCEFLLSRAEINPKSQLGSKDTKSQLDELIAIHSKANGFLELAKTGIEKKMPWTTFKNFAASKEVVLSDYYQPQYDGMYMRQYCGQAKTESSVKIENGVTKDHSIKKSFMLKPNPLEHEYSKQIQPVK